MNWKEEAVEKLRRYPVMAGALQVIPLELQRLEREAGDLQGAGFTARGGSSANNRAQENRLLDNLVRRKELEQQLEQARLWVEVTQAGLAQLDERERLILQRLYGQQVDAVTLGRELGLERSSLYRCRDAALKKLTLALYGVLES